MVMISRLDLLVLVAVVKNPEKKALLLMIIVGSLEATDAEILFLASTWWMCEKLISPWELSILQTSCLVKLDISTSCSLSSLKSSLELFGVW